MDTDITLAVAGYLFCLVLLAWAVGETIAWITERYGKGKK